MQIFLPEDVEKFGGVRIFSYLCISKQGKMVMEDLYSQVLERISDGMRITFTPSNVAPYDGFLLFNRNRRSQTITFHTKSVPFWIDFDGDEPMRLEDCPESFFESILLNTE